MGNDSPKEGNVITQEIKDKARTFQAAAEALKASLDDEALSEDSLFLCERLLNNVDGCMREFLGEIGCHVEG